jgi:Catalase
MTLAESEPPSRAWQEIILPGEETFIREFARDIGLFQKEDAEGKKLLRGFHAKIQAGLIGEFEVLSGLPDYARQGVFREPRTFPAVVRFSNGESKIYPDTKHEPRGIAIKLIGVGGRKALPDQQGAATQDFLGTSHSVTSTVRNIMQFAAFVRAHRPGASMLGDLRRALGWWETLRILWSLFFTVGLAKVRSMATEHYSGTAPIKFGPYAVKFTIRPAERTAPPADRPRTDSFLHEELADRLRKSDLVFDFLVQFYVDDERTPIEDTSVHWQPKHSPLVKVARLRIPSCDLDSDAAREQTEAVDALSFSPWHALEDHRPLGSVMRARKFAYEASSALRNHDPEPTGLPLKRHLPQ